MPSINLAPGTEFIIAARKRRQRLYGIAIAIISLTGIGYGGLWFMEHSLNNQNEALINGIHAAEAQIQKSQADVVRVELFEKRLTQTKTLLDSHVIWDKVFADLERLLPPTVTLTSVDMGTDASTLIVQGFTPDVDAVAQAISSLSAGENHVSLFSKGIMKNITKAEQRDLNLAAAPTGYSFAITLTIDPAKLKGAGAQ